VQLNCSIDHQKVLWHIVTQNNVSYTIIEGPLLSLSNITEAENGRYRCSVIVSGKVVESNWATIKVFGKC